MLGIEDVDGISEKEGFCFGGDSVERIGRFSVRLEIRLAWLILQIHTIDTNTLIIDISSVKATDTRT